MTALDEDINQNPAMERTSACHETLSDWERLIVGSSTLLSQKPSGMQGESCLCCPRVKPRAHREKQSAHGKSHKSSCPYQCAGSPLTACLGRILHDSSTESDDVLHPHHPTPEEELPFCFNERASGPSAVRPCLLESIPQI
ncbi:unnamed protein product [Pleuronectes platessa]|uniref:Uncharacterized protein n=1 Tax=Pleuronectes platessa TaxID=8262 RepID=A0A9N7Y8Z8_PLEPL|nr:unnamed protein product [Pleuronectes platessa]